MGKVVFLDFFVLFPFSLAFARLILATWRPTPRW